jgi:hypothetical protein
MNREEAIKAIKDGTHVLDVESHSFLGWFLFCIKKSVL